MRHDLTRLFRPRSVAIVGLNDKIKIPAIQNLINHPELDIYLVHPSRPTLYERNTHPDLRAIGRPVDAVLSLVSAARTSEIVAQARETKAGGVVIVAAGFKEAGEQGQQLERDLVAAAADEVPCLGPNCFGFADITRSVDLALASAAPSGAHSGSIGLVTHTGGMIPALITAGLDRNIGFSYAISTGNETNVDLVDCLEFLIDDPNTRVIALIVEGIKRPDAFFNAASRAMHKGKPIVALKLGRSARSVAMAKSHTGSIAGEAWVYHAAFRQYGIAVANDITELLDKLAGFAQLRQDRWERSGSVAVLTPTGGGASLASDVFADFNIELPAMESIRAPLREVLAAADILNPLDTTGFLFSDPQLGERLAALYAQASEAKTLVFQWHLQNQLLELGQPFIAHLMRECAQHHKNFVLSAPDDGHIESGAQQLAKQGVVLARGAVAAARALRSMTDFSQAHKRHQASERVPVTAALPAPAAHDIVASEAGPMLSFAATMRLLSSVGIEVAPYRVVAAEQTDIVLPPGEKFVVKLADVPHRTDIGALRFNVASGAVKAAVEELRALAQRLDLPQAVAIQPQLRIDGEAFIGVNADSGLGPMVVCGIGGIFVEVLKRVCGVIAPFSHQDAAHALLDLDDTGVFKGLRGSAPWNRDRLAAAMVAAARLASGGQHWIASLDINPLAISADRLIALDGLCILQASSARDAR